jgi:hypothetical protein
MSERTSPPDSARMGTKNELHLGVTYHPKTNEALYRTHVPHGESLTLHTKIHLLGDYICASIGVTLNGNAWFQSSHTDFLETNKRGITCMISNFGETAADITVVNKSTSDEEVILGINPVFKQGDILLEAADPQIVLPPSKSLCVK